ncbi:hypothetical protein R0J87_20680, partial [Halomonas sp. SIMBA_159]
VGAFARFDLRSASAAMCSTVEHRLQRCAGVARANLHDSFGVRSSDDCPATHTAFGTEVDAAASLGYNLEVMLDHHDAMAAVSETMQHAN